MELNTILELVKAGFTKDEIMQMEQTAVQNTNTEPVQTPVDTPAQDQPSMADIMQGIAKLTSAVQANAIAQSVIPQGLQTPPSAEDMLAEIIRPSFKERG